MILHQNGFIELTYDVATDILTVRWPNVRAASGAELLYSFEKLLEVIRGYDIKKVLFDSRSNNLAVSDEEYRALNAQLGRDLVQTRVKKVARLGNFNTKRETILKDLSDEVLAETKADLHFQMFDTFADEERALQWLQED
ncbi:hypothetical protein [Pontibacter liquoris]|uniref:hypothetical protein n=1 Tax=Pontibacter liquoris TaxID=2905677 RepID=UPI001FA6D85B|nr:hypothetical protein [Pontibacter liquoris]